MRKLTGTGLGVLILAAVFLLGGLTCVVWPKAAVVAHASFGRWGGKEFVEPVSETRSRVDGVLAMLLGLGIGALALYRAKT